MEEGGGEREGERQISSFLGEAVERSHFSGLCRNLHIQLLILEPVFLLLPAAAEEEEEATSQ